MRPRIRTNCWLCIVSSIALVVSGLSSPIRPPRHPTPAPTPTSSPGISPSSPPGSGPAITSATPDRTSVDADRSDFDEEDEDESFWSFSHLVCPTFIPSDSPPKLLSGPRPGNSPPRTAAVPLRC